MMRLLLDTSAALALVLKDNESHSRVRERVRGHELGLAGHARFETYSVLTRLPGTARLSGPAAVRVVRRAFPATVALSKSLALQAPRLMSEAGIAGGATYDGLVALAAREAGAPLLSCDRRAARTYALLGVETTIL